MGILSGLEPASVFGYFEEITRIPHGSADVKVISDYLVHFAEERHLEVRQDEALNVVIKKPASAGYDPGPYGYGCRTGSGYFHRYDERSSGT